MNHDRNFRMKSPFFRQPLWRALLSVLLVGAVGCTNNSHQQQTAAVSGKVTLDGKPLKGGYLTATPSSGKPAKATIQPDGSFVLSTYKDGDGAQLGTHPVTISPPVIDEFTPKQAVNVKIPSRYGRAASSGLTVTVEADGENHPVFELSSK